MRHETTLSGLLTMTLEPLYCAYKRFMLRQAIRKEWIYSEFFAKQAEQARKGHADSQKRIIRLNAELRQYE